MKKVLFEEFFEKILFRWHTATRNEPLCTDGQLGQIRRASRQSRIQRLGCEGLENCFDARQRS